MKKLIADDLRPYDKLNLMFFNSGVLVENEDAERIAGGYWNTKLKTMRTGLVIEDVIDTHNYLTLLNERKDVKIFGVKVNTKGQKTYTRLR